VAPNTCTATLGCARGWSGPCSAQNDLAAASAVFTYIPRRGSQGHCRPHYALLRQYPAHFPGVNATAVLVFRTRHRLRWHAAHLECGGLTPLFAGGFHAKWPFPRRQGRFRTQPQLGEKSLLAAILGSSGGRGWRRPSARGFACLRSRNRPKMSLPLAFSMGPSSFSNHGNLRASLSPANHWHYLFIY
jgi:hypothetical protein